MKHFFLLVLILGLFASTCTFWQGLHNEDLGFNIKQINKETGSNYNDIGLDGETRTSTDLWLLGGKQILYGFLFTFVLSLCIGYYIGCEYKKEGFKQDK